jgi:hypothetical protein
MRTTLGSSAFAPRRGRSIFGGAVTHHDGATASQTRRKESLQQLREDLALPLVDWNVAFRIDGLDAEGLPLHVGNVEFLVMEPERLGRIYDHIDDRLEKAPNIGRRAARDLWGGEISGHFENQVAGLVTTQAADGEAAIENAGDELRFTLDTINFFSDLLGGRGHQSYVYVNGEFAPRERWSIATASAQGPMFKLNCRWAGQLRPLAAKTLTNTQATRLGFSRLSTLLQSRTPKSLAQRLVGSIHWSGRAATATRDHEAFLFYAVGLESLLLGETNAPEIGYRLKTRLAHLIGGNSEARQRS